MQTMKTFTCDRCHQAKEHPSDSCTTGYGTDKDGNKICFACCGDEDRKHMETGDRITLYLSYEVTQAAYTDAHGNRWGERREYSVGNWPGTLKIRATVQKGRHNIAGTRYDLWFTDHAGQQWHGVQYGENTQLCHCRKLKAQRKAA